MNNYELDLLFIKLEEALEESLGEITPEIETMLAAYEVSIDELFDNLKFKIDEYKGGIVGLQDTIKQLQHKIKRKEQVIETAKRHIMNMLKEHGTKTEKGTYKHKTNLFNFYTVERTVYDYDKEELPNEILRYKMTVDWEAYKAMVDNEIIISADDELPPLQKTLKTMNDEELADNNIKKYYKQSLTIR